MKRFLMFGMVMVMIIGLSSGCSVIGGSNKATYYDSPQDLAEAFVEAFNDQDMDTLKVVFGIEMFGEYFDYEKMTERLGSTTPMMGVPNDSDFTKEMNKSRYQGQLYNQLRTFITTLNSEMDPYVSYALDPNEDLINDYIDDFSDIDEIEITHIYEIDLDSDQYDEHMKEQGDIFDAERRLEYVMTFEYDGDDYYCGLSMYEFDDGYILDGLYSSIIGASQGSAEKLTDDMEDNLDDEYDEIY